MTYLSSPEAEALPAHKPWELRRTMNEGQSRAKEFVADVRAGMPDMDLQTKYGLKKSKFFFYKATALDFLAKQEAKTSKSKRKINGHQLLSDVKSGMDDDSLMEKYNLTSRELQSVLRQIIHAGLATVMELSARLSITKSQVREAFVEMGKAIHELD